MDLSVRDRAPLVVVHLRLERLRPNLVGGPLGRLVVAPGEVVHQPVRRQRSLRPGEGEHGDEHVRRAGLDDASGLLGLVRDVRVRELGVLGVDHQGAPLDLRRVLAAEERLNVPAILPEDEVLGIPRPPTDTGRDEGHRLRALHEPLSGDALSAEVVRLDRGDRRSLEPLTVEHLGADRGSVEARDDVRSHELRHSLLGGCSHRSKLPRFLNRHRNTRHVSKRYERTLHQSMIIDSFSTNHSCD